MVYICRVSYCIVGLRFRVIALILLFLAHLSLLRVSFWDTGMSVVRLMCGRTRRPKRPSVNFLACVHSSGNSFDPKFMKLCQNINHHNVKSGLKLGHVGSKTRSLGQILEKPCVHSRGHRFDHKFIKPCQNVNHHNV